MAPKSKPVNLLHKIWHFLWYDDSWQSWVISTILAFLLIKFVFYPLLGLGLGVTYPVVAVVSGSMEHNVALTPACAKVENGQCTEIIEVYSICGKRFTEKQTLDLEEWWNTCGDWYTANKFNITKGSFEKFPFKNGFNKGDVMVLRGKDAKDITIGDILVYQTSQPYPIIHRVIAIREENGHFTFTTKGDHNSDMIRRSDYEVNIDQSQVLGTAWFRIPFIGYVKVWSSEYILAPITNLFK